MTASKAFKDFVLPFVTTSVGRKTVMSLTGLGGIVYLIIHLIGNTVVYEGPATFNGYAGSLHAVPFLPLIEAALALLFAVHIALGVILTFQNWAARPLPYDTLANHGGKTLASTTMIYTGLTILAFMLFHVWSMRYAHGEATPVFDRVRGDLSSSAYACCYAVGLIAVGLHLSHGASSCLFSLGLRHPLHDPWVDLFGKIGAALLAVAFGTLIFWFLVLGGPAAATGKGAAAVVPEQRMHATQGRSGRCPVAGADGAVCPVQGGAESNGP